jgi:hypothetical protein
MPKAPQIGKSPDFFQSWDHILKDLQDLLGAKACVEANAEPAAASLETIMAICLPALCQRLCQLASRLGPTIGGTSASVMICHENNRDRGHLYLRVYESFPNYGLDRTIHVRGGQWRLHLRDVDYGNPANFEVNDDVVARALSQQKDIYLPVDPETSTPSEKQQSICAIHSIIPNQLKSLEDIRQVPIGAVVALNVDFYAIEERGYASHQVVGRSYVLKELLSQVHAFSLFNSLPEDERRSVAQDIVRSQQAANKPGFSLPEFAQQSLTIVNYGELKVSAGDFHETAGSPLAGVDMIALAVELGSLRERLRISANTQDDATIKHVDAAEKAARAGNAKSVVRHLKNAGEWALNTATEIGVNVASEVIKKSMGL